MSGRADEVAIDLATVAPASDTADRAVIASSYDKLRGEEEESTDDTDFFS